MHHLLHVSRQTFTKDHTGSCINVMCLTSQGMASDWYFLTRAHEAALVWKWQYHFYTEQFLFSPLVLEYIWVHSWNQIVFSFKISQKRKLHTHTIHTRFSYKIKLIHIFTTHINTNIHIDISIFAALLGKRVHHGEIKTVHTFFLCLTFHGKWRWLRECIGTLELCQGEGSTVFQRGNTVYFVIHTGRV